MIIGVKLSSRQRFLISASRLATPTLFVQKWVNSAQPLDTHTSANAPRFHVLWAKLKAPVAFLSPLWTLSPSGSSGAILEAQIARVFIHRGRRGDHHRRHEATVILTCWKNHGCLNRIVGMPVSIQIQWIKMCVPSNRKRGGSMMDGGQRVRIVSEYVRREENCHKQDCCRCKLVRKSSCITIRFRWHFHFQHHRF
jgi:hypothetical protein